MFDKICIANWERGGDESKIASTIYAKCSGDSDYSSAIQKFASEGVQSNILVQFNFVIRK